MSCILIRNVATTAGKWIYIDGGTFSYLVDNESTIVNYSTILACRLRAEEVVRSLPKSRVFRSGG